MATKKKEETSEAAFVNYDVTVDEVAAKEIELCASNQGILPEDFITQAILEKIDKCSSTDWRDKWLVK
jgi:hypothetical protein